MSKVTLNSFDSSQHSHRRFNPLTGRWVLVSPHRTQRPWQGKQESQASGSRPAFDPGCYLCPSTKRAGGKINPAYTGPFVFQNDFSALLPDAPVDQFDEHDLLRSESESGICRVICFSPRHDLTLPEMPVSDIRKLVDLWTSQYLELGNMEDINHVQIFENKGEIMGCSNPHPHGQIWAQRSIPDEVRIESERMREYFEKTGQTLLGDYCRVEQERGERIICENEGFVALVPFWANWPFETLVLCKRRVSHIGEMTDEERDDLADMLKRLTTRYDNLFECSFPYSAGMHQSPTDGASYCEWDWHLHFYPPLLRSATVKKFMVGYEMLADPQRDLTPEVAAERLREVPEVHYSSRGELKPKLQK